jgi:hypothetical protein
MKAKMTVYQKGGKVPPKKMPAHLKSDAAKLSSTPSEVKVSQLKSQQGREMKDYKAAGRVGADQSGIFEGMKVTNKKLSEMEAKAKAERAAKEKARASYMPKYAGGGKVNVAGAKVSDGDMSVAGKKKPGVYKYLGYSKGGKVPKYLSGGQVKLDKNKDGKISGVDFKMMK